MSFSITVPVEFRLCRTEDLPALEWMGLHSRDRDIIAAAFAAQQRGEMLILLALGNGYPIGQVWIDMAQRGTTTSPHFWAIRVFPPLQGNGLGQRLLQEAEEMVSAKGARYAELGVERENSDALRFYERLGYEPMGSPMDAMRGVPASEAGLMLVRKSLTPSAQAGRQRSSTCR